MESYQLLSVKSPSVEITLGDVTVQSNVIKNTDKNPNFDDPLVFRDLVRPPLKLAFHGADTNTDTDILADILAMIVTRMSVSVSVLVSVTASWNPSLNQDNRLVFEQLTERVW